MVSRHLELRERTSQFVLRRCWALLAFNAHYHHGKNVECPAKLAGASKGNDTMKAETQRDDCWM